MKEWAYVLLLFFVLIPVASCSSDNKIQVTNLNHSLDNKGNGQIVFLDPQNNILIDGVMGFQLEENVFYGWCNNPSLKYYLVDLKSNSVSYFDNQDALNFALSNKGIKPLLMKNEITYWDIKKAKKKSVAEFIHSTKDSKDIHE